jgi:DNA-binding response OmpR family regulator
MGADAWLPQGVGLNVIAAQARAALKAPTRERAFAIIQAGRLRMDVAGRRVHLDGREVSLKPREFELLKVLLDNQGTALSRERILAGAWGTRFVGEPKTVDVHMAWLRPKLDGSGVRVTTLRGVGYRLDVLDRGEGLALPHSAQAEPLALRLP